MAQQGDPKQAAGVISGPEKWDEVRADSGRLDRTVFVAYPYEISQDDYRGALTRVAEEFGVEFIFADERITNKHILQKIADMIEESVFGIYDVTYGNPNVTLELGIAIGSDADFSVVFNQKLTSERAGRHESVPTDLGGIDRFQYESFSELEDGVRRLVADRFGNPKAPGVDDASDAQPFAKLLEGLNARILEAVRDAPGIRVGGIAAKVELPVRFTQPAVRGLVDEGELCQTGVKKGAQYFLPEDAVEE